MEREEIIIAAITGVSALGSWLTYRVRRWYRKSKLKEEKETLDAQESAAKAQADYWRKKYESEGYK